MNRGVNLTKRVQTSHGWRYCTVVLSANGRVKPDLVVVNGKQETHKEGAYYLEWREGAKRVRLSVGKDPADASARRQRKEAELNAVNHGGGHTTKLSSRLASLSQAIHLKSQRQAPRCDLRKEGGAYRMDLTLTPRSNWEDSPSWNSPRWMLRSIGQPVAQPPRMGLWRSVR
jgi:hypothetical protein